MLLSVAAPRAGSMFSTAYHISGWLWARAQLWSLLQPCASSPTSAGSPEGTWVDARALLPTQHALARQSSTPAEGSQLFGSKTSELDALGMLLVITEKAGKTTLTRTGFETGKKGFFAGHSASPTIANRLSNKSQSWHVLHL